MRRRGFTFDAVSTTFATGLVVASNLLVGFLLARRGTTTFAVYNLVKRDSAAVLPILSLGLTIALPRMIASRSSVKDQKTFKAAGAAITLLVITVTCLATLLCAPELGRLISGKTDSLCGWGTWLWTASIVLAAVVYSIFRGSLNQEAANMNNILSAAVLPALVVFLVPKTTSVDGLLLFTAMPVFIWNAGFLVFFFAQGFEGLHLLSAAKRLFRFGMPRIPAGVAAGLTMALPPMIARKSVSMEAAGSILAGLAIAQIGMSAVQALSVILLPRVAALSSRGEHEAVRRVSGQVLTSLLLMSAVLTPVIVWEAADILGVWLGSGFLSATSVVRVMSLAVPAVVLYGVMSSIVDAAISRPVNTYATVCGLCVGVTIALLRADVIWIASGWVIGQWTAAIIVVGAVLVRFGPPVRWRLVVGTLGLECGLTFLVSSVTHSLPILLRISCAAILVLGSSAALLVIYVRKETHS